MYTYMLLNICYCLFFNVMANSMGKYLNTNVAIHEVTCAVIADENENLKLNILVMDSHDFTRVTQDFVCAGNGFKA